MLCGQPVFAASGRNATTQDIKLPNNHSSTAGLVRPRNIILSQLPEAEYAALARWLQPVELPLNMALSEPNQPIEYVYFLNSG